MEILKDKIIIDKKIGKETNQILIEGDVIVPDNKPDIDIVLEANANSYIYSKDIVNDRITFKGNLDINILFIEKGENKHIYNMQSTYPINDFINMEGIDKNMSVFTISNITNLDYKLVNDRKVSFRAVVDIETEVLNKEEVEIVKDVNGLDKKQMKIKNFNVNKVAYAKFDTFNVKDDIEVTSVRPNIKEILDVSFNIANKNIKTVSDKVNIVGDIRATILYKSDEEDSIITYFEQDIPFNGVISTEGVSEDMIGEVYLDIQNKNIQILEDDDGEDRIIGVDLVIGCNMKVTYDENMDILEDAYSLNSKIFIEKQDETYPLNICRNKNQSAIKENVKLDEDLPPILQILKVSGKTILDNVNVLEDKVMAEGIIDCKILYITNNDEYPMYCFNTIIPYSQAIETKGATLSSKVDIHCNLEYIGVNMLSNKDIEIRCNLNFDTNVYCENKFSLVKDLKFEDLDEDFLNSIPSMIIYIVSDGDTLWDLAKKFNTTIDDIVNINELEDKDNLQIGQKLLILKNIV